MPQDDHCFAGFDPVYQLAQLFFDFCDGSLHDQKPDYFLFEVNPVIGREE